MIGQTLMVNTCILEGTLKQLIVVQPLPLFSFH
jgi:hypothetical protein